MAYVIKCLPYCSAMPLKPHELVQIQWKLTAVTPLHPLQFRIHPVPVTFDVLSVNTCHWILEMKGMIHCLVSGHIGQRANIAVCPPLITPDLSVGFRILLRKW